MQYYPVIYTRTRCCDYFAGFHVRPDFVVPAEVLPYIRTATTDMDAYEHTRKHIIISTNTMILFGMVGYIQDIGGSDVELYARDEKNRAIFGFYGFAAKRGTDFHTSKIPDIQNHDIIQAYKKYVTPYWNCLDQETQNAEPISLEEKEIAVSPIPEGFLWNETVRVYSETDSPDCLYTALLLDALNGTVLSYCSCVNDFKALKNSRFSHVVTNKNNRFRLKKEQEDRLEQKRKKRLEQEHQKRLEQNEEYLEKEDNESAIGDDSPYGQKKNQDDFENCSGIRSDLDSNLSDFGDYYDWEDVLEESEREQLTEKVVKEIQEALEKEASESKGLDSFLKKHLKHIVAAFFSVMIPIMIHLMIRLMKKYNTTAKNTSEKGETEDAE